MKLPPPVDKTRIRIRRCSLPQALEVIARIPDATLQEAAVKSEVFWGAFVRGLPTPVGVAGASVRRHVLHLDAVWVQPEFQGRGLQRRFVRVQVAWGKRWGAKKAKTYVYASNGASLVNFLRSGFWVVGVKANFLYLEKAL